ncbi:phage tail terminator family protein [Methanolapillus millepedarum]|uniref:Uncharacterized protein n=1 Tax=Methanolapillus millepedarum TaxID=3028296 RepID=A0AA96VGN4_9EURY|nr:hypothetical protein MsAc7_17650 [Methanosarcinaceae archaeon Ac7]
MADDWLNAIIGDYSKEVLDEYYSDDTPENPKPKLGIAGRIRETFPDTDEKKYKIYFRDDVTQGLEEPCFFIMRLLSATREVVYPRFSLNTSFDVHYFPTPNTKTRFTETATVEMMLQDILEFIIVIDPETMQTFQIHGTGIRAEMHDDVLHCFVNYNTHFIKPVPKEPAMEEVELTQKVK